MDISRVAKVINSSLQHQTMLIKEEGLSTQKVLEDYADFINENRISVFFF